ncbi:MAG: tRNA (adenosine(37)-N6)-dimethylallyltransferase MiaA, partial [Propionibacteriaceae bacterium]|nr:tRNA (adenosine(37)-N6)-dimethylallyltransferase MiaA [Propionibacteriaceae bacterium]
MSKAVIAINGPTASGKSQLAVTLAKAIGAAQIINADSMLVYKGMDIGTAKPTLAERGGVPHHLIDIMEITDEASVAEFQVLARSAIHAVQESGCVPILVGGSALYMRAIIDEFNFPKTDKSVREKWERRLLQIGSTALHAELATLSPAAAAGILPGNGRRIVRALEVVELEGSFSPTIPTGRYALENVIQVGLELPREVVDERIETRVQQMWDAGFVGEVEHL